MTVLFGGTFDPVHNGHVWAVSAILKELPDIKRFIIMPAFVNPFKQGAVQGAAPEERLEMCRAVFGRFPVCEVSSYEIDAGCVSYTYNTLMYLREKYPDEQLVLAVGGDSLATLGKWYKAKEILETAVIAAVRRDDELPLDGYADRLRDMGGDVRIIDTGAVVVSSTQVRSLLLRGLPADDLIPAEAAAYIREKGLYDIQHG